MYGSVYQRGRRRRPPHRHHNRIYFCVPLPLHRPVFLAIIIPNETINRHQITIDSCDQL